MPDGHFHRLGAFIQQGAPAGHGLLHAQTQEAQEGFEHDHPRHQQGGVDRHDPQHVGYDVTGDDLPLGDAADVGRLDELLALEAQGLAPHYPRHVEPAHRPDGDKDERQIAAKEGDQHDDEEHEGEGVEDLQYPHHQAVDPTADKAGGGAIEGTDDDGHHGPHDADHQRDAPAEQGAHEQIAPQAVGAKPVAGFHVRSCLHGAPVRIVEGVLGQMRPHDHRQTDDGQDDQAGERRLVAQETATGILPQGASFHHFHFLGERLDGFALFSCDYHDELPA